VRKRPEILPLHMQRADECACARTPCPTAAYAANAQVRCNCQKNKEDSGNIPISWGRPNRSVSGAFERQIDRLMNRSMNR
jgi:hypothetical protein